MSTRLATSNVYKGLGPKAAQHALATVLAFHPDLGGLQEWGKQRDSILKQARLYDFARNDAGGGPVFWLRHRYGLVSCRAVTLSRRSFVGVLTGRKSTLPTNFATLAVLHDDDTGADVAVINFHLTAEVQYGGGYRTDAEHQSRVRRHKREVRKLGRVARRQVRKGRTVYALGDTNFEGLEISGLVSCWEDRRGKTLGGRAVDVVYAAGPAKGVQTVKTGSDHLAVIVDYL